MEEKKRGRGRPKKEETAKKKKYYGRWTRSTGFYTMPNGERIEMTEEQYLDFVKKTRGLYAAHTIKMRMKQRDNGNNFEQTKNVNHSEMNPLIPTEEELEKIKLGLELDEKIKAQIARGEKFSKLEQVKVFAAKNLLKKYLGDDYQDEDKIVGLFES